MSQFPLMPLPYATSDLEPLFSSRAVATHYEQHHIKYCTTLNLLLEQADTAPKSLEHLIQNSTGKLFNQAAQLWNHSFYWACLGPKQTNPLGPSPSLSARVAKSFQNFDSFKTQYLDAAKQVFGSGWIWLVQTTDHELKIFSTSNADTPLRLNWLPLLCTDLWEHAYYLDYQADRASYLEQWWALVNWNFVERQFEQPFAYSKNLKE